MLIVGLGNPGSEYQDTRHNIGFRAVDALAGIFSFSWTESKKFKANIAMGFVESTKLILLKPSTYMNLSGESVQLVKAYYNINIDDIIVIHDELDIDLGRIKYKKAGGSAGHNGIKSIDQSIGNEYHRIRIGIGKPIRGDVSNYVLGKFSPDEEEKVSSILNMITSKDKEILSKKFSSLNL